MSAAALAVLGYVLLQPVLERLTFPSVVVVSVTSRPSARALFSTCRRSAPASPLPRAHGATPMNER